MTEVRGTCTAPDTHQEGKFHSLSLPQSPQHPICALLGTHSRFYLVWGQMLMDLVTISPSLTLHGIRIMSSLKTKGWASPTPGSLISPGLGKGVSGSHMCTLPENAGLPAPAMSLSLGPAGCWVHLAPVSGALHHPQLPWLLWACRLLLSCSIPSTGRHHLFHRRQPAARHRAADALAPLAARGHTLHIPGASLVLRADQGVCLQVLD